MKRSAGVLFVMLTAACGGSLPARYVIERDLGDYHYRRYQETLDAEVTLAGNHARGHTAAYMRRDDTRQTVDVVSAFVTVYEKPASLTETLRAELAALPGYELRTQEVAGQYVWLLASGTDANFWMWPAGRYVVKLGAAVGQAVPDAIAEPYAALYPSDLDSHGHAREGALSAGSAPEAADAEEPTAPVTAKQTGKPSGKTQETKPR